MPLISIITVCYNSISSIEKTILSVIKQNYNNIEYVVVDGGSSDGTLDIIQKYKDNITYFISEPDNGIYDAMNKGIKVSSGDYVIFMNSGDQFNNSNVLSSVSGILNCLTYDIVYGDVVYHYTFGERVVPAKAVSYIKRGMPCSHQSVFVKSSIYKKRSFNLVYKLAADYEFLHWSYCSGKSFYKMPISVSLVDTTDGATCSNFQKSSIETMKIQHLYGRNLLACYYGYILKILRFRLSFIVKNKIPLLFKNNRSS